MRVCMDVHTYMSHTYTCQTCRGAAVARVQSWARVGLGAVWAVAVDVCMRFVCMARVGDARCIGVGPRLRLRTGL